MPTNLDCLVALRTEITAALAAVEIPVAGLQDLMQVSLSAEALTEVQNSLNAHSRRRDLLQNVLRQLDDLEAALRDLMADGYPALPPEPVSQGVFDELVQQQAELDQAFKQFAVQMAAKIVSDLGQPTDKPVL